MHPIVRLGPLNLSSAGLLLVVALVVGSALAERAARRRGGPALADQVAALTVPALLGAAAGGRLWFGLLNWDLYGAAPGLFLAPRIADMAWPGALLGGALAGALWARLRGLRGAEAADAAALALPVAQAIACAGLLLSGEAFGAATALPWAVQLFGAARHPTQIYLAIAALLGLAPLLALARRPAPAGALFACYLALQGLAMLLLEPLRADSLLLPLGVRAAQVAGLGLLLAALVWLRARSGPAAPPPARSETSL